MPKCTMPPSPNCRTHKKPPPQGDNFFQANKMIPRWALVKLLKTRPTPDTDSRDRSPAVAEAMAAVLIQKNWATVRYDQSNESKSWIP